jgi:hypothetical protein
MLHVLAALAIIAAVAPTPSKRPPHRTLIVQLVHHCHPKTDCLPSRILTSMKNEADKVWSSLDVRLAWVDSSDAARAAHAPGLTVNLEERAYPASALHHEFVLAALTQPEDACGWGSAHVWVRQIERHAALVSRGDHAFNSLPPALADIFLARALGRALAHEIGHYLLGTREHTLRGLMRAQFTPQDLLGDAIGPLYGLDTTLRARFVPCRTRDDSESDGSR